MKIACLHTMDSNAALFEAVTPDGVTLSHTVRQDLLDRALAAGGADEAILSDAVSALNELSGDAVLLTCSSIGLAAGRAGAIRVDAALAEAAVADGGTVDVLVTAPSTVEPTRELFEAAATKTGAKINMVLIENAIEKFQAGALDEYAKIVAAAADSSTADVVALGQASMAPAAAVTKRAVMTSPEAGLKAAIEAARMT